MKAIEHLKDEHRAIEKQLKRLLAALDPFNADGIRRGIYFASDFIDEVHHRKEEDVLFQALSKEGKSLVAGMVAAIEKDHGAARAYLRAARQSFHAAAGGNTAAMERLVQALRAFVEQMVVHMQREEDILFPVLEKSLSDSADPEILIRFREAQRQHLEDAKYDAYLEGHLEIPTGVPLDARSLTQVTSEERNEETSPFAKAGTALYDDGHHKCFLLHDFGRGLSVQANQYLIIDGDEGIVLDPGGPKVYPDVLADTMVHLAKAKLRYIFLSHQDPDIGTSINAWMMDTEADAYVSRLWIRFLPHYGIDKYMEHRLKPIPDEGMTLPLGTTKLKLVPAHFLHSPGNFQLYDPVSKVLFSGDLGGSMGDDHIYVRSFEEHANYMLGFHQRYMASNKAMKAWAKMARKLDIEVIAPQHGAIFSGKPLVDQFIRWCEDLVCGVDVLPDVFNIPD